MHKPREFWRANNMAMDHRETEYNTELTKIHHTNYVRNSRAIVVLWAIFTIIFLVLNIVVFIQPQWIGDTGDSPIAGYFGLYKYCTEGELDDEFPCTGDFIEWDSILNSYFKATSVMVGLSCLLSILVIGCFLLFCLLNTATVLNICAWFQILCAALMAVSVIIYPGGWDEPEIQQVCGLQASSYDIGLCGMRWGYVLAIVLVFDALILAILAFVLAAKQGNLLPEVYKDEKDTHTFMTSHPVKSTTNDPYDDYYEVRTTTITRSQGKTNNSFIMD